MDVPIIQTSSLSKSYGKFAAVRALTFFVAENQTTALVGLNGAGKSTTLKMLLGMIRPTSGSGTVLGQSIADPIACMEARKKIAYVSENKVLYNYMTVEQMIRFTSAFYKDWRLDVERRLIKEYRLPSAALTKSLSKGMRTKLHLLLAFARRPALLILDEPTDGLDPIGIEQLFGSLASMREDGTSVLFSSHQLPDVERVADHVFMIHEGQLVLNTSLLQLQEYRQVDFLFPYPPEAKTFRTSGVESIQVDGRRMKVIVSGDVAAFIERARALHGNMTKDVKVGLREVFLGKAQEVESALV